MKWKLFYSTMALCIFLGGCGIGSTQKMVEENYSNGEGLILSYPGKEDSGSLSESAGLYMEFLVNAKDEKAFRMQTESLRKHFAIQKEGRVFLRWQTEEGTQVNALVDDLRIIGALEAAGGLFHEKAYADLARQMRDSISEKQTTNGYTVDFYDWELEMPASRITLSYLIDEKGVTPKTLELLRDLEEDSIFFPEYFDVEKNSYSKNAEVHMIDQLLIALNRHNIGEQSGAFDQWLVEEWSGKEKVYGRYSRETGEPLVKYESLAVYYYLQLYFQTIGEDNLAAEVVDHTGKLATDEMLGQAHFFDFIHYRLMQQNR